MTTIQERAEKAAKIKKELAQEEILSENYEEYEGEIRSKSGHWLFSEVWEIRDLGYPRESDFPMARKSIVDLDVKVHMPEQLFSLLRLKILPYCQSGYGRYTMSAWISESCNILHYI